MIAGLLKIDTKLQYCCIKARLPTRKLKIHSGNLRGKLKVESLSAMLWFVYFFKRKIWGSSFSSLKKNYLEMIPWKEPLTDYRLVLRWPLCYYCTCHESTGHLDLEHRVWNEKIDLFLKTRLTWDLKVIFVLWRNHHSCLFCRTYYGWQPYRRRCQGKTGFCLVRYLRAGLLERHQFL